MEVQNQADMYVHTQMLYLSFHHGVIFLDPVVSHTPSGQSSVPSVPSHSAAEETGALWKTKHAVSHKLYSDY